MLNYYIKKKIKLITLIFLCVICIISVKSENITFRIRKCCAENEFIAVESAACVENKLFSRKNDMYLHANISDLFEKKEKNNGLSDSWPLWIPQVKIISRESNEYIKGFPGKFNIIYGHGQPCDESVTYAIVDKWHNYTFYNDGSLVIYPNEDNIFMNKKVFDPLSFCIDRLDNEPEALDAALDFPVINEFYLKLCPCTKTTCIRKCCAPRMVYDMRMDGIAYDPCIGNNKDAWIPISSEEDNATDYFLLYGFPECSEGENVVLPNYLNSNDSGYVIYSNGTARIIGETYISQPLQFCGENVIDKDNKIHNYILRCFPKAGVKGWWSEVRRLLYGWLFVIGAIFLLLTLLVHSWLPLGVKLNDSSLIFHTWSLFIGYVSCAASKLLMYILPQGICIFLGFLTQYCFLSAFLWLNVLCFDISYTFSILRSARSKYVQNKKRIFYFTYGWIVPAVIVVITVIFELHPGDSKFKPEITSSCWFKNGSLALLVFFYVPIASVLAVNLVLFLYTSFKIIQAQNDISSTLKNRCFEKQRFMLFLKLFLLMGLSWITEMISWAIDAADYLWLIPDSINLLRAVYIFVLVCCKKKVINELRKIFGFQKEYNVRRPSNTRSSSLLGSSNIEAYNFPNNADSNF